MSADTIPADVLALAKAAIARVEKTMCPTFASDAGDLGEQGRISRDDLDILQIAILADRSTRPAEPAAPVAEAGDGEVVACVLKSDTGDQIFWLNGARDRCPNSTTLVRLSTLEAERARADDNRQKLRDANADRSQLLANLQALRTEMATRVTDMQDRAEAAEQRAADALARAEKAQVALLSAREAMLMARDVLADPSTAGIDDVIWMPEAVSMGETLHDYLERSAEFAARASREAQPATDGGDNG